MQAETAETVVLVTFFAIYFGVLLLLGLVPYILGGIGMMTMAKRCSVPWYGLAWVPIGNLYVLGALADFYAWNGKGKVTRSRVVLPAVAGVVFVLSLAMVVLAVLADLVEPGLMIWLLVLLLLMVAVSIAFSVLYYIAHYKVFQLFDPNNAVVFLILSIFIQILPGIFLFVCRNKPFSVSGPQPEALTE